MQMITHLITVDEIWQTVWNCAILSRFFPPLIPSCPLATGLLEDLLEDLLEVLLVLLPQSWQLTTFFLNSFGWLSLSGWTELKVRTTYHMFSNVCTNSSEWRLVL